MRKYKLLIVDDEIEVRKGIINKVNWEKLGFEIVAEGENGQEALELFEKTLPDVVLTDIKMPFMDGLELSRRIKEKYPTTKIIVMTGFDEFEYAHKAIKLNVSEYLLRPISSEEITNILLKVKGQIDKEIAEKENVEALKEHYKKSIPVLREKFLISLITSGLDRKEIEQNSNNYDINLNGNEFMVSVISIDKKKKESNESGSDNEVLLREKGLLKFAVLNTTQEIVDKYNLGTVFLKDENIIILTVHGDKENEVIADKTFSAIEELKQVLEKFLKVTVTVGVGNVVKDVVLLRNSYENAVAALDYRIFMGKNKIIWIEDIEPVSVNKIVFDETKERTLTSGIKVGTKEEITSTIDKLFEDIIDSKASFKDYQIYIMEMLTTILKAARDSSVDIDEIFGVDHNLFVELYSLSGIEEAKGWFKDISVRIMNFIVKDRQDTYQHLVKKAKDYIKESYGNSDININEVCNYLHLSTTYFSFIFKKETKTTFVNYLTQVRMDAAKELLRTTNLKAFEIAEKVGYSEPNYFSYSFKKKFGVSPSEFRNSSK
ncbi:response regulator receiver domain protein [Clostridiales bacterium oral taxon 876 str. F0540]|nr:response regulator receiver domain protein [Clostridiales bacterium oral taxon 876 str. F0540]